MKRAPGDYTALTARQAELLSFLRYRQAAGATPSFQEMADEIHAASKSAIYRLLDSLEERGYLKRIPNRARAVEVFPTRRVVTGDLAGLNIVELLDELSRRGLKVTLA